MNHIYKTILNKTTGQISVVSEKTSSHSQSQKGEATQQKNETVDHPLFIQNTLAFPKIKQNRLALSIGLALTTLFSSSVFATTYTGDGSVLVNSTAVGGNFNQIIQNDTAYGVVGLDTNIPAQVIASDTNITIDYATGITPDFVLAGYNAVNLDDSTETVESSNNTINLVQGNVNGQVYAGLVHGTSVTGNTVCTDDDSSCLDIDHILSDKTITNNNNKVNVSDQHAVVVSGAMNAGYTEINLIHGDLNTVNANYSESISDNTINTHENKVLIQGNKHSVYDINAGYAVVNSYFGDLTAVNNDASAFAEVNNNLIHANDNSVSIAGNENFAHDLAAGYIEFNSVHGDSAATGASIFVSTSSNDITTNNNSISMMGDHHAVNHLAAGYVALNFNFSDLSVTDTNASVNINLSENVINANENSISIEGEENTLNDITAGYIGLNPTHNNLLGMTEGSMSVSLNSNELTTNDNSISIIGNHHSISHLTAGYTGINFNIGDFSSAQSYATANAYNTAGLNQINANENKISIQGDQNSTYDITAGVAAIQFNFSDLSANAPEASATHNINTNSNNINANENNILIQGNQNSMRDIAAGYTVIHFNASDLIATNTNINTGTYEYKSNANANAVFIVGNKNATQDLNIGYAVNNLQFGDLNANNATNSSSSITSTFWNTSINANKNNVSIAGDENVIHNISVGYAGINFNVDNLYATNIQSNSRVVANVNDSLINTNENEITIKGNGNFTNDISTGYAGINFSYGDFKATNITFTPTISENTLSANENSISIEGNKNTFNDITVSNTGINLTANDLTATNSASAQIVTNSNTINSSDSLISVTGDQNKFNNMTVGAAAIDLNFMATTTDGNADSRNDTSNNTITANDNTISITGDHFTAQQLTAGVAKIHFNVGDLIAHNSNTDANVHENILNANQNIISIVGNDHSINNISAGAAGINLQFANILGSADANLNIDLSNTTLSASNNEIHLAGRSTMNGNVHTGYIDFNINHGRVEADGNEGLINIDLAGTSALATDNIITIDGNHTFTNKDASIYGGYLAYNSINGTDYKPESYDVFTGNTLNYANKTPISIGEVANFQTYNFTLNPELANKNEALITADQITLGTNASNTSSDKAAKVSDVYVTGIHSGKLLDSNTKFILMQSSNELQGEGQGYLSEGVAQQGISLLYDVETEIDKANNQVIATITAGHKDAGPKVNPQLKPILEGNLAGLMLLTRGADDIADNLQSIISEQNQSRGLVPYVNFSGHYARYDSGSHIKAKGGLLNTGFSFQQDQMILGAFIESGWGSYDTYNTFRNAAKVEGEGNNRYTGVGVYGHYDFEEGFYVDGSFRGGRLRNKFNTNDLRNAATGETARYNVSGTYFGAHIGGGYQLALNAENQLDLSAKYLWSSTESQDLKVAGDPIHFDGLNSHRLRLKGENSYQINSDYSLLTGLGYEYEFDGKAQGTTYRQFSIDAPSVKGSTGLAMVGVRYEPTSNQDLTVDFKANGYFGKRDGGSALLKVDYKF